MLTKSPTTIDLQDIAEVGIFTSAGEVNRHLALGWLLLGLSSNQYSENGYTLNYHLGWRHSLGEIQRAESDMDTYLNQRNKSNESPQENTPEQE